MELINVYSDGKRITYTYKGGNSVFVATYPVGELRYKKLMDRD